MLTDLQHDCVLTVVLTEKDILTVRDALTGHGASAGGVGEVVASRTGQGSESEAVRHHLEKRSHFAYVGEPGSIAPHLNSTVY